MSKLSISNVVRVTLVQALRGLSNINTSALAIITDEAPIPADYGTSGVYLSADGVADDFGSTSDTYALALAVFNQSPNIITGGGFLVVIPREQSASASAATLIESAPVNLLNMTATDYNINLAVDGGVAGDLLIGEIDTTSIEDAEDSLNSTAVQAAGVVFEVGGELNAATITLRSATTGASSEVVVGSSSTGTDAATPLNLSGSAIGTDAGLESIKDTILRTNGAVDYFGIVYTTKLSDAEVAAIAPVVQSQDKIQFVGSNLTADIAGQFTTVKDAGYVNTRCLLYTVSEASALEFAAGYASRGLSINFDAANTALTMHLKEVTGLTADTGLTQTIATSAKNAGVDVYADFGVPKVFTSGANQFFDQTYTRLAFKLRLQIAGFNFLATVSTKIPQTEAGMSALKAEYRKVCETFRTAGVFAPGSWSGSIPFGTPDDFIRNITDNGYYVYSLAISAQSQTEREARVAPVVQIAAKDAGAIHSSDVTVQVQA